jgi:prepilin-type N-terminal cleavage/methylation domain-containing protein
MFLQASRETKAPKGLTLIEMIVCIVIAAIFIPMAYIAFMAAARGSMNPESVVTARFLAERKIEELTKDAYANLQDEQASYVVISGYDRYYWRWTITNVAYQDRTPHGNPTIGIPETWQPETTYRVGDYIGGTSGGSEICFYRCVPRDRWRPNTAYSVGYYASPTTPSYYSYRCTAPRWEPNHPYSQGSFVVPTSWNSHAYMCTTTGVSGASEPDPWPTGAGGTYAGDGTVAWREALPTTGASEPDPWPTSLGATYSDGTVMWVAETMRSGYTEPSWSCAPGEELDDGSLRWKESTAYKQITVYVKNPQGYEYVVNTIVSARPGVYP